MLDIAVGVITEGFIFGILALGAYISYKILDFPDLSVDGTFPLGAAVTAAMITAGANPWLSLLMSIIAGALAGAFTGFLNVKLKFKDLLCGILTMTLLYSVNYRIAGKPNIFLLNKITIFDNMSAVLPMLSTSYVKLLTVALLAFVSKFALDWYLSTKSGFILRSAGDNPSLVVTMAQNPGKIKIIGLAISNALVALAGCISCQSTMSFNVSGGTGKVVMGLAAVIIGTTVFKKLKLMRVTTAVIIGMLIYKTCISLALGLGFESYDLNMIVTVLFIATLIINNALSKKRGEDIA